MPIKATGFDKDIEALTVEVEREVQEIAFAWLQAIMIGTPVDTGFHRNNWHLDFGSVNVRVEGSAPASGRDQALTSLPPLDGTSSGRLRAAASFLESWTIESGSIFIHNSGPAIEYLDDGSSAQADQGILDLATAAVRAEFGLS
ncbi:MAG: hypothetical protein ACR2P3_00780 [Geminicoccaceae bacterium]